MSIFDKLPNEPPAITLIFRESDEESILYSGGGYLWRYWKIDKVLPLFGEIKAGTFHSCGIDDSILMPCNCDRLYACSKCGCGLFHKLKIKITNE